MRFVNKLAAFAFASLSCACGASPAVPCPQPPVPTAEASAEPAAPPEAEALKAPFRGAYVAEQLVHEGQAVPAREVFLGDRHPQCFHFRWLWVFDETRLAVRLETLCEVATSEDGVRSDYVSCIAELSTDVVWEAADRMRVPQAVSARGEVAQLSRRKTASSEGEIHEDKQNCSVSIDAAVWTVSDVSGADSDAQPAGFALTNDSGARWEVTATVPSFDRQAIIAAHVTQAAQPR